jgi:endoglucanase
MSVCVALLLRDALRHTDLGQICPGLWPAGRASRAATESRRPRSARVDGAGSAAALSGWRCRGTFDVSGGWYDAGDYGKYASSGAIAVWQLLSTLDLLRRTDHTPVSELADMIRTECRWQLDWLLRMQVPDSDPLAGLVFHRVHGTRWSPMPGWAHEDPTERVLRRPSTAASLQMAAVTAQGARLFRPTDPTYAQTLLGAARSAYEAALRHPRLIAPDDHAKFGGGPYSDDRLEDDFYWAAAELWLATGEETYRQQLANSPQHAAEAIEPSRLRLRPRDCTSSARSGIGPQ